jgi:hypothetical protein
MMPVRLVGAISAFAADYIRPPDEINPLRARNLAANAGELDQQGRLTPA